MQAFFEKISKKFQRQCSRMELFPFGGGRFWGSAMGRRAEILCAAQGVEGNHGTSGGNTSRSLMKFIHLYM